ncbi:MAG: hypothetical protein ACJAWO_002411 [Halieaceae bacterium]
MQEQMRTNFYTSHLLMEITLRAQKIWLVGIVML